MKNENLKITLDGQAYDVKIREMNPNELQVTVNGEIHHLTVEQVQVESSIQMAAATALANQSQPVPQPIQQKQPAPTQAGVLSAPMPGDLIEIQVKIGDKVEPGQAVCVLEAMKMKNILRASQHGRVAEILIQIGQTVEFGTALVRFD